MKIFRLRDLAFLLSIMALTIYSCKPEADVVDLKFNLEKGKIYEYDMVWDMTQKLMGQESNIAITSLYSMEVVEANENSTTLKGTYQKFAMKMNMMGIEMNIDTDGPASVNTADTSKNPLAMMNKIFAGIKGKSFTLVVNKEGEITSVSGFRQVVRDMVDSLDMPDDAKTQARVSLNDQFNDESIKAQFAMAFTIYPNKEVKVGDSWDKMISLGGSTPATYATTYTVREIKNDIVTLDAKTKMSGTEEGLKIEGGQTSVMILDSKTGLVKSADFDQKFTGSSADFSMEVESKGKVKGNVAN